MFKFIKEWINDIRDRRDRKKQLYPILNDMCQRIAKLEEQMTELSKRTISGRTTEEEVVPFSQVVDEWLNGAEETGNGN